MATYYIDTINGNLKNDGLKETSPLSDYKQLKLIPGDTVLFKRGTFLREKLYRTEGVEGKPITYGAYGEGEIPTFCGSIDLSDTSFWIRESENIWVLNIDDMDEVCNIIFNYDQCATLRWTKEELSEQGDFFDNCFGYVEKRKKLDKNHRVYLYSKDNPAKFYTSIECVVYGKRNLADNGHDIIYKDLKFINSGVHAIAGVSKTKNLKVIGCHFHKIGGAVWDYEQKIRFGNAVELWNVCENVEISDCYFDDIYDSATTHQGGEECEKADGFIIRNNVFKRCGMAAYEQRDMMPKNLEFLDNICIDAGEGFSKLGITMPRYSEIWPEPMGHHLFLWRMDDADEKDNLIFKNNIFYNAPYGAAIYSNIASVCEEKIKFLHNSYYTSGDGFIAKFNNTVYRDFCEFSKYDKDGKYDKTDIGKVLSDWENSVKK